MKLTVPYNVISKQRKQLAEDASVALHTIPKYLGYPTCAYQIGDCTLERDGRLVIDKEKMAQEWCVYGGNMENEKNTHFSFLCSSKSRKKSLFKLTIPIEKRKKSDSLDLCKVKREIALYKF